MSSEVKHYWPEEIVGTGEIVVYLQDYAALEAECERLRGEACELNQRREALALRVLGAEQERDALAAELQAARGLLERITTACNLEAYGSSLHDARAFLDAAPPAAQDVSGLVEALHSMTCAYRSAIQAGYDRITALGGDCDSVQLMLNNYPDYRKAVALIAAHRQAQRQAG